MPPRDTALKAVPDDDGAADTSLELARPDSKIAAGYLALRQDTDRVIRTIETNLGGERISPTDLDRIKMGLGGMTQWMKSSLDGDDQVVPKVQGIIIHMKNTRSYWPGEYTGAKTPPQCWSDDAVSGYGDPGDSHPEKAAGQRAPYSCAACPNAQFTSDGGRGQACKMMRVVFLLDPKKLLPDVIILPPTSLTIMRRFLMRMSSEDLVYHGAIVELGLKQATNKEGIKYVELAPTVVDRLSDEQTLKVQRLAEALRPSLERIRIDDNPDVQIGAVDATAVTVESTVNPAN